MPDSKDCGDTITLHKDSDDRYHWQCPNCNRKNLGLDAETNLDDFLPTVKCRNCDFEFGVAHKEEP